MKNERDELIVVPEQDMGGFMCPKCLAVAIGKKWATHAKYCPDCGQHIRISTSEFNSLLLQVQGLDNEQKKETCMFYMGGSISGIYKDRVKALQKAGEQIDGQMDITDFLGN